MVIKLATYSVKPESINKVKTAILKYVEAINKNEPDTSYESFQHDENSFVHLMKFQNEEAEEYHRTSEHTKKFVGIIYPECVEPPVFKELTLVR